MLAGTFEPPPDEHPPYRPKTAVMTSNTVSKAFLYFNTPSVKREISSFLHFRNFEL